MEQVLSRENMNLAFKRVKTNKGSHGVDGMSIDETYEYLKIHSREIGKAIREGTYKPKPVLRVEIPKQEGGVRLLGIPTVLDRIIQQAITQVISPIFEKEFSDSSYGWETRKKCQTGCIAGKILYRSRIHMGCGY